MNFGSFASFGRGATVRPIHPQDAISRVEKGELTLLDVREHNELAMTGKARGAVHVPMMLLQMQADPRSPEKHPDLDPERPVAVYCASGARSQAAAQALLSMGYREVYNLGGLMHWQAGGGACEAA